MHKFFDKYPEFVQTAKSGKKEMNSRWHAIINWHKEIYADAVVLDLGCQNGRLSHAALCAGAELTVGVDFDQQSIEAARTILAKYQVPGTFRLIEQDLEVFLRAAQTSLNPGVVLCCGLLYHMHSPFHILLLISKLNPKHIVVDTEINQDETPTLRYNHYGDKAFSKKAQLCFTCIPSRAWVTGALRTLGYTAEWFNWTTWIKDNADDQEAREGSQAYAQGNRVTLLATKVKL